MLGLGIVASTLAVELFSSGFVLAVGAYEIAKRISGTKRTSKRK